MNRRLFTKVTGVSVVGVLAGCTSPDDDESEDTDDGAVAEDDDEPADDDAEEPIDDEPEETDDDVGDEDPADDDPDEEMDEDASDEEPVDDGTDEEADEDADDEEPADDTDEEADEETDDEEPADEDADEESEDGEADETDEDDTDDDSSEPDELDAELVLDDELEDLLEVDHEFVWESSEGSHLCNINVEMDNTSATAELYYEGVGMITDADGNHLSSDAARFSLDPENSSEHSFSLDQCAETAAYRVEFEADQIVEE
ncbi:hypothetical protein C491_17689 [Natronococcus amylolyticus DSM 10524]|uniref:Uncharacterized protein n=1 Tax=Natronococcus amylolyticus DSM 10524 TaxID=1227497 RepID=L9X2Y6_9EURY|nr:hypothetical protein [Natronococcus amylolyticus]ELY54953.1 hypothetical protein C491_17689 [Natronococcus amylolyticus DSM 10524]